jgi:hypothetical protein
MQKAAGASRGGLRHPATAIYFLSDGTLPSTPLT